MSDAATYQILSDLIHWLLLSLPLALVVHAAQSRARGAIPIGHPKLQVANAHRPGTPSDLLDLLVAVGILLAIRSMVVAPPAPAGHPPSFGLTTVVADVAAKGCILALLMGYLTGLRARPLVQWLGLHTPDARTLARQAITWTLGGAALAWIAARLVSGLVLTPLGFDPTAQDVVRFFEETSSLSTRVLLALTACTITPVVEEVVFRGFLYPVLRQFTDAPFAILFTGLVFGIVHRNLHGAAPLALLGIVLALAYERSRSLCLPIAIHALFNTASIILLSWPSPPPVPP